MENEVHGVMPQIKYNNVVDDETVVVGKDTQKASQKETKQMLEMQLDTMDKKDPARSVYEKVYDGVKKYY